MCYTGQCPYEKGGGDAIGECSLGHGAPMPPDALCVLIEEEIERKVRRESPLRWLWEYRVLQIGPIRELTFRVESLWFRLRYGTKGGEVPF